MTIRNKTQYDVSQVLSEGTFQTISEVANEKYATGVWRNYATWSPLQRSRDWNTIVKNNSVPVMASLLDVNSAKPLTSLAGYEKYGGDIPKIGIGSKIEEQDILNKNLLGAVGDELGENDAKDLVLTPLEDLYAGVHSRLDFFCLQGISTGNIIVDVTNQVNGKYITMPLNVPAANKRNAAVVWSDPSADPIKQLLAEQKYAKDTLRLGLSNFHWEMNQATYDVFIDHPNVIKYVQGRLTQGVTSTDYLLVESEKLAVLRVLGIAPIVVIDHVCKFESDGAPIDIEPFNGDNVVLITNTPWFDMKRAVSAHSLVSDSSAMRSTVEEAIAAVSVWDSLTVTNVINVEAWAFPVPKDPKQILIFTIA